MSGIRTRLAMNVALVAVLVGALVSALPARAADGPQPAPTLDPSEVATASSTFSFDAEDGVVCDGTGAQGWRAHTFIVNDDVNPSTLDFTNAGLPAGYVGADFNSTDGTIMAPLHKGANPAINLLPATTPAGLVDPTSLAGFNFNPAVWTLADDDYQIGFACVDGPGTVRQWWTVTVTIDTSGSPFMVVKIPDAEPQATSVALSANPPSASAGTEVTFTATVTPAGAAGTVEFFVDGASQSTAAVAGGTATWTTSSLTVGTKSITAAFTPGDPDLFTASTAPPLAYTVAGAGAQATTVTLTASPAGQAVTGETVTVTVTITPSGAAGDVTFGVNGTALGTVLGVTNGEVIIEITGLPVGTYSFAATFIPDDAEAFQGSSGSLEYTVVASETPTTTTTSTATTTTSSPTSSTTTSFASGSSTTGSSSSGSSTETSTGTSGTGSSGSDLPFTGIDLRYAALGLALVYVGRVLYLLSRRPVTES